MTRWLDRTLTQCAYYYCLCLSEKQFHAELKKLKLPPHRWDAFLSPSAHATMYHFEHGGNMIAIVCLDAELAKQKTGHASSSFSA